MEFKAVASTRVWMASGCIANSRQSTPATSSHRSPRSFICSPHERGATYLLLSRPCTRFATEPWFLPRGGRPATLPAVAIAAVLAPRTAECARYDLPAAPMATAATSDGAATISAPRLPAAATASRPSCVRLPWPCSPRSFLRLPWPPTGHAEEQWSSAMTMTTWPFGSLGLGPMGCRAGSVQHI